MNTPIVSVLDSVREHLAAFAVPSPLRVAVCLPIGRHTTATIQLAGHDLPVLAADLLAWADTLDQPGLTMWRYAKPDPAWLHLTLSGLLTDGTPVEVFGEVPHFGPGTGSLRPGDRVSLSFALLREWSTFIPGEVA